MGRSRGDPERELLPALDARRFAAHVRHLKRRYHVVRASELPDAAAGRRRGHRIPVAVTFDDDLPEHAEVAAPILSSHRTPATFFLCGASLERPFAFWWERLQHAFERGADLTSIVAPGVTIHAAAAAIHDLVPSARSAAADRLAEILGPDPPRAGVHADDVRALVAAGFEVGFHTREHHVLTSLDDPGLRAALNDGRVDLEQLVGASLDTVAYPHGEVDARVTSAARAAGFRVGFTTEREPVRPELDPLCLGRYEPFLASVGAFALDVARTASARDRR